jgi:flagellar basal body rod protein FlgB
MLGSRTLWRGIAAGLVIAAGAAQTRADDPAPANEGSGQVASTPTATRKPLPRVHAPARPGAIRVLPANSSTSTTITKDGATTTRASTTTLASGAQVASTDTRTRDGNTVTRSGQTTGPNGAVSTRESTTVREGDSTTLSATTTGPNGKSINSSDTWTRKEGVVTREGTTTNAQGQTATRSSTLTRQEDGTVTRESSRTGFDGKQSSSTATWSKGEDGVSKSKTISLPNGNTVQQEVNHTKNADGSRTRVSVETGPKGKSRTSTDTWKQDANSVSHQGQTTNAKGEVIKQRSSSATRDANTVNIERERSRAKPQGAKGSGRAKR